MAINYPQRYDDDFVNIIKKVIDHVNQYGKTIQDLVAEGQLTDEQYAKLITVVSGLVKSGEIKKSDLSDELNAVIDNKRDTKKLIGLHDLDSDALGAIDNGDGSTFELLSIPRPSSVSPDKFDATFSEMIDLVNNNLFSGTLVDGNVDIHTGEVVLANEPERMATEFIEIDDKKPIISNLREVTTPNSASNTFIFYYADKDFIKSDSVQGHTITPPSGARFVRQNVVIPNREFDVDSYFIAQNEDLWTSRKFEKIDEIEENLTKIEDSFLQSGTIRQVDYDRNKVFVYDFNDVNKTDSEIISNALDFSSIFKEKTIIFDQKDWYIDEAIELPPNTKVIVDGCMIKQNDEVFDNVFRGDNLIIDIDNPYGFPSDIKETENLKIIGLNGAKIEGPDVNKVGYHPPMDEDQEMVGDYWGWRTLQISFSLCRNFEITGIEFTKTRCWAISLDKCHYGHIDDLIVDSRVKNGDGVDIRAGCSNIIVDNIGGYTSDDTVACTAFRGVVTEGEYIYPNGNYLYPLEPSRYMNVDMTDRQLDIHDISISNITTGGWAHGVICLTGNGLRVYNIKISNITDGVSGERESTVKIYSGYGGGYIDNDLNSIRINNVTSRIAAYAVMIDQKVDNVWLNKISTENTNGSLTNISNEDGVTITNS